MMIRKLLLAFIAAAIIVALLVLAISVALPEKGTFQTEPEQRVVHQLKLTENECKSAKYFFKDLYSEKYKGCTSDSQCEMVVHPIGCTTAIGSEYSEMFHLRRDFVNTAMKNNDYRCGLPVAMCKRGRKSTKCVESKCTLIVKGPLDVDLNIRPDMSNVN